MLFSFAETFHVDISKTTIPNLFSAWKKDHGVLMFKGWPMQLQFKQYPSPPQLATEGKIIENHLRTG